MQTAPAGRQFMQGGTDMEKNITIRPERVSDYQQVEDIIRQAFYNLYTPGCTEHYLVESGEIRFPCNYSEDIFAPKADTLGIYGQNGSGKTTFIDALEILKTLLSGQKVGAELSDCISYGQEKAELQFEFRRLFFRGLSTGRL